MTENIHIVIGASGGIGAKFVEKLSENDSNKVYTFSRSQTYFNQPNVYEGSIDISSESSIQAAAKTIPKKGTVLSIIVTTGFL